MLEEIVLRLTRVETRLVQLMLHQGLDPYKKTYDDHGPAGPEQRF